jgi:deglycase
MKVAILVTNGFEQSEMTEPKKALEQAGAQAFIISPAGKRVRGWKPMEWGDSFSVDVALDDAQPRDYSALLLPGGVMNPDYPRAQRQEVVIDDRLVTSRKPDDIPAFNQKMIEFFAQKEEPRRATA